MIKPACQLHPLYRACTITAAAGDTLQKERASPALLSVPFCYCSMWGPVTLTPAGYLAKVVPMSCQFPTESQQYHKDSFLQSSAGVQSAQQHWHIPLASRRLLRVCQLPRCFLGTTSQWASVLW